MKLLYMPLTLVCMLCLCKNVYSQNSTTIIPFGITDTASVIQTTFDQVLTHRDLTCKEPKCKVTSFDITFLPKGKEMKGPYPNNGTSTLQGLALDALKETQESKNTSTRIFIENIHVNCNGKDMIVAPIYLVCTQ